MMLPNIDVRTVMLLLAVGNLVSAGLFAVYRIGHRRPTVYLAARVFQAMAWLLLYQRGEVPFWLWYLMGNLLINLGWALEATAVLTLRQKDRRVTLAYTALVVVASGVTLACFVARPSPNVLNAVASLLAVGIFMTPGLRLMANPGGSLLQRTIGALYLLFCLACLLRAGYMLQADETIYLVTPTLVHTLTFLSLFALLVFGNMGYVLIQKEDADQALVQAAMTDPLTGLSNRRSFHESAEQVIHLASRRGEAVSVLMVDLDHFKRINDTFGHAAGDGVLKRFAATTRRLLRPHDLLGRVGGEEFCVLMLCPADEALQVAERIRAAAQVQVFDRHPDLRLTVSVGVCTRVPQSLEDLQAITAGADAALYQAKNSGRDRVCVAAPAET